MGGNLTTNSQISNSVSKIGEKAKIIKRYQNRKLYDTQQSCYVTLDDIAKMVRGKEDVTVIDNKTKNDITAATLTQIIFESEKKSAQYAPLFTLREIIQHGNGSISGYLAKLGAFPAVESVPILNDIKIEIGKASFDDVKHGLESRIATVATVIADSASSSSAGHRLMDAEELTPNLPNSNKTFNN